METLFILLFFVGGLAALAGYLQRRHQRAKATQQNGFQRDLSSKLISSMGTPIQAPEPLSAIQGFDIDAAEPAQFRPFKPKFFMQMGIERCSPNDLFLMDKLYVPRIKLRESILDKHQSTVLGCAPECVSAVLELYEYILGMHMPTRFPDYFIADRERGVFVNKLLGGEYPLKAPETNGGIDALRILALTVEDDLLLLQRSATGEYLLSAFACCFPSGFDASRKFGLTLRGIHGPVPQYKEKLAMSMDRFFARLEVGRIVKRLNWAIATTDELFTPSGNHFYEGDVMPDSEKNLEMSKTYLRVERQTLHRLPESQAILFTIKTYLTPLSQIKEEGLGNALATAVEGLPEVMGVYKKRVVWGPAVIEGLRA